MISPSLSLYFSEITSRSASRIFCIITCLAVCAAIRPNCSLSTSVSPLKTVISPVSVSISTDISSLERSGSPIILYAALVRALSIASKRISLLIPFSRSKRSIADKSLSFIIYLHRLFTYFFHSQSSFRYLITFYFNNSPTVFFYSNITVITDS